MMHEEPKAPMTSLMPAIVEIAADAPSAGCWDIHFTIREAAFENYRVVPWNHTDREPRVFKTAVFCSDVYDPVPKLHEFVYDLADSYPEYQHWYVDEEGSEVFLKCWLHGENNIQLRFYSKDRAGSPDFKYDLLVDRKSFYEALHPVLLSFYANGGWNSADDWYGYDREPDDEDRQELNQLIIDDGTIDNQMPDVDASAFCRAHITAAVVKDNTAPQYLVAVLAEGVEEQLVLRICAVHHWWEDADSALMSEAPYGRIFLSTFWSNSMEWWIEGSDVLLRIRHTNGVPTNDSAYATMPVDVRISRENFREIVTVLRSAADR